MLGNQPAICTFTLEALARIVWRWALSDGLRAIATRMESSVSILRGL